MRKVQKEHIVKTTHTEPPIDSLQDRHIRFDIACRAENGELVNVEMSLNPDPFEPVRLEFHAGKLFTGQNRVVRKLQFQNKSAKNSEKQRFSQDL